MAKPDVTLSRFANGPGEDVVQPSSGLRNTGFVDGTPAVPSYVNALFLQAYEWASYIDAAVWDGDLTVDGNLVVNDDTSLAGDLEVLGDITGTPNFSGIPTFAVGLSASDDVNTTAEIRGADLRHTAAQPILIHSASAIAEVTGGPDAYTHGAGWSLQEFVGDLVYPIPLRYGDSIVDWFLYANKLSDDTNTITVRLTKTDVITGTVVDIQTLTNAEDGPGDIIFHGTTDHVTDGSHTLSVVVNGGGQNGDSSRELIVNVTRA